MVRFFCLTDLFDCQRHFNSLKTLSRATKIIRWWMPLFIAAVQQTFTIRALSGHKVFWPLNIIKLIKAAYSQCPFKSDCSGCNLSLTEIIWSRRRFTIIYTNTTNNNVNIYFTVNLFSRAQGCILYWFLFQSVLKVVQKVCIKLFHSGQQLTFWPPHLNRYFSLFSTSNTFSCTNTFALIQSFVLRCGEAELSPNL